jgi:hypothetical protein
VVDANLGKLARYLRLLGFDTRYRNDFDDPELAEISAKEHRILLTRDRDLLKRSLVTHGYYVRARKPDRQVQEVLERFDLRRSLQPFQRCTACNGELTEVPKESVAERLEPKTRHYHDRFWHCGGCDRIYWRGGHYRRMRHWLQSLQTEFRLPPTG